MKQYTKNDSTADSNDASCQKGVCEPKTIGTSFCENCGNEINRSAKYCPECGHSIHGNKTSARPSGYSFLWVIIGFLFPYLGIVLAISQSENKPVESKMLIHGVGLFFVLCGFVALCSIDAYVFYHEFGGIYRDEGEWRGNRIEGVLCNFLLSGIALCIMGIIARRKKKNSSSSSIVALGIIYIIADLLLHIIKDKDDVQLLTPLIVVAQIIVLFIIAKSIKKLNNPYNGFIAMILPIIFISLIWSTYLIMMTGGGTYPNVSGIMISTVIYHALLLLVSYELIFSSSFESEHHSFAKDRNV